MSFTSQTVFNTRNPRFQYNAIWRPCSIAYFTLNFIDHTNIRRAMEPVKAATCAVSLVVGMIIGAKRMVTIKFIVVRTGRRLSFNITGFTKNYFFY